MNLIGYGLAKFDNEFVREFGQPTKSAFARYVVSLGLANTTKAVSNRNVHGFANIVKLYIRELDSSVSFETEELTPTQKSRFKQLQETGREAEFFFMSNYKSVPLFKTGILEDARLWGDGYDFQVKCNDTYFLTEVKGVRSSTGSIRLTQNEYNKAVEYKDDYILVVVSNLISTPKLNYIENPTQRLSLVSREQTTTQINYYSENLKW